MPLMDSDDPRGLVGLQNLGNTCYINAALQALSNCQQLTRYVLDSTDLSNDRGLSVCYRELIRELWSPQSPQYANPASIIHDIKSIFPAFRGCTQQDTQEFLRCFLEKLHDELKKPEPDQSAETQTTTTPTTTPTATAATETATTSTTPTQQKQCQQEQRSIISDTFEFRISSSIVCSNCNNISTTKETFKDLSVPIPSRDHPHFQQVAKTELTSLSYLDAIPLARWFLNWISQISDWFWGPHISLYDCLSVFFGTDPLDGDNQYSCEVCTEKHKGVKYLTILDLPEVLCIHFKRYESVASAKITSHVTFPLEGLDLAPYLCPNTSRPQCTTYNLIACICHHGSALLTGHYTTYALNCYDDQWYEFDDQYVTCVSGYQVENSEAYILFYQKTHEDESSGHLDKDLPDDEC